MKKKPRSKEREGWLKECQRKTKLGFLELKEIVLELQGSPPSISKNKRIKQFIRMKN